MCAIWFLTQNMNSNALFLSVGLLEKDNCLLNHYSKNCSSDSCTGKSCSALKTVISSTSWRFSERTVFSSRNADSLGIHVDF